MDIYIFVHINISPLTTCYSSRLRYFYTGNDFVRSNALFIFNISIWCPYTNVSCDPNAVFFKRSAEIAPKI